jgi:rhodanese-related sulfurtransferase
MPLSRRDSADGASLLDVRDPSDLAVEHGTGAGNLPLPAVTTKAEGEGREEQG